MSLSDLTKYPLTRTSRGLSATAELLVVYVFVLSLGYSSMLLLVVSHLGHIVSDDCNDKLILLIGVVYCAAKLIMYYVV